MVKTQEAIVVEGRYDKNTLSQIIDAPILQTDGFGIMNDKEQLALLRNIAKKRGLIIFTDSDGAGFVIRNFLKGSIPGEYLKHAYIPDIPGKERRKAAPGKEGKLGVEGMTPEIILQALKRAGATFEDENLQKEDADITKVDMAVMGLSGGPGSAQLRRKLLKQLELPEHMSSNALLQVLNILYTKDEVQAIVEGL
ncbi:MAG: DUF4093 domain-containing protein [Oscillospiraceae bacterium]|nr:DUF4093 domain-containing protein [Oscillospiraceae bacterium]